MALRFYKHGQGKLSRGLAALTAGLLGLFACYSLYDWLGAYDPFKKRLPWLPETVLGPDVKVNLALLCSLGLFAVIAAGIYYASNRPRVTDFLLETESEMKKVSWPSAREVWGSTLVVLALVVILGLYILAVDSLLGFLRTRISNLFGG